MRAAGGDRIVSQPPILIKVIHRNNDRMSLLVARQSDAGQRMIVSIKQK